jgi:hypothetical protein
MLQKADSAGRTLRAAATACAATSLFATALLLSLDAGAKPDPNADGRLLCERRNYDEVGGTTYLGDDRKCCYWEYSHAGEGMRVCLQCDENWKNCEETIPSRGPVSTAPRSDEMAPKSDESGGVGTKVPGKSLNNPPIMLKPKPE